MRLDVAEVAKATSAASGPNVSTARWKLGCALHEGRRFARVPV